MILAVMQARMSSTRLPGKVLRPLAGAPMILRQIERVRRSACIDRLVVATSSDRTDNVLADVLQHAGVELVRGDLADVLGRFAKALEAYPDTDHVVRLTADCPLTDPGVIDAVIARHLDSGADYTSNTALNRTFPKGLDCEVMTAAALRTAAAEAVEPDEREHVTMFLYRRPDRFRLAQLDQDRDEGEVRWTVDRPDDYAFVEAVYDALYEGDPAFGSDEVRNFVRTRPEFADLGGDRRA